MIHRWAVLVAFAAASCGGDGRINLGLPPDAVGSSTNILWLDGHLTVLGDAPVEHGADSSERSNLFLLSYDASPDQLGVGPGELAPGQTCRACELAEPDTVHQAVVFDGRLDAPWTAVQVPDGVLDDLTPDRARCDLCAPFEQVRLQGDSSPDFPVAKAAFLVPLGDGEDILMGWTDGTMRLMHPERRPSEPGFESVEACQRSPAFAPEDGYEAGNGLLWAALSNRHIVALDISRLPYDGPCDELVVDSSTTPSPIRIDHLAGERSASPTEWFTISRPDATGEEATIVQRYSREDGWSEVGRLLGPDNDAGVAWKAPGEGLAVSGGVEHMRIEGGTSRIVRTHVGGTEIFVGSVRWFPPWGYLLGTSNSLILRESGGGWEYLADLVSAAQRVSSFEVYERNGVRGLAIGTRTGAGLLYFDETGYCAAEIIFGKAAAVAEIPRRMAVTPKGALVGGADEPYWAIPPPKECSD